MRIRAVALSAIIAFSFIAGTCGFPAPALAQTVGSVSGSVTDGKQGLGNARITIAGAGRSQTITSGANGSFSVSVAPGIYTITATAAGFQSTESDNVVVSAGQTVTLSFALATASLTTIGRVSRSYTAVNTSPAATNSVTIDNFIDQGQKQVNNVIDQIPGININRGSSNEPGGNASISIRGAQPYESQILIDGHPVNTSANGAYGFNTTFVNSLLLGSVEVSKGPGNLPLTVEDAVGGSLNFKTPSITATPTASLLLGYDSFNGNYYGVRLSDTFGKIGVLVGVARNQTPGYLGSQTVYGGNNNEPGIPVYPDPNYAFGRGQQYVGVVNFAYPATSDFASDSQLYKLAYNFSPQTSLQFSAYSTQTLLDETGNNIQNIYAKILPCINNDTSDPTQPTCAPVPPGTINYNYNYTNQQYANLIGKTVPINFYAAYPNTYEFDNEPIFTGEFRTTIGPGSLLARYYAGSISRTVTQNANPGANSPCYTPACPNASFDNNAPQDNGYPGEPYTEPTIDVLHGFDAQYSLPFGANNVSIGFDRHVDSASFGEDYNYDTGLPTAFTNLPIQSIAYSVRGDLQITSNLSFDPGLYLSSTSYVGTRFDPRGGLVYKFNPDATLRLSAGSAFVAPYYGLILTKPRFNKGTSTLTIPTTNFRPETSMGYDIGSDIKVGRDSLISLDVYHTTIYNRYATVTLPQSGTYEGTPYSYVTQNGNQADVRNDGVEFSFAHVPTVGLGGHTTVDLLRDYAYNQQVGNVSVSNIFIGGSPADNVQLPGYPFSKIVSDLFYNFRDGAQVSFGSTTYGDNNSFGQSAFTEFQAAIRMPLHYGIYLTAGATNLFNHDDYQTGGIYNGGYTYPEVGGGIGPTSLFFYQPRTVYFQLTRTIGPKGSSAPTPTSF